MIRVAVLGLGAMGLTHLAAYARRPGDAQVVAVADRNADKRQGDRGAQGNIAGQAAGSFDPTTVTTFDDPLHCILESDADLIDICLPTPMHAPLVRAAIEAGRHVLVEKPPARTATEAEALADLARAHPDQLLMPAMCMRYWPGWDWLHTAVTDGRFGRVRSATFQRLASLPEKSFYRDEAASGGAILDLHLHDVDFIHHCFGQPHAVTSRGHRQLTGGIDHVVTQYDFGPAGPIVTAEGSWSLTPGSPFVMRYTVVFERATAVYDLNAPAPLLVYAGDRTSAPPADAVPLADTLGYDAMVDAVLDHLLGRPGQPLVDLPSVTAAMRTVEAEAESIRSNRPVAL